MSARPVAVECAGLVTSVGMTTAMACAALHCRLNNFDEIDASDSQDEPLVGAAVPWPEPCIGIRKLARMAASAMAQALAGVVSDLPMPELLARIPVLLCIAEPARAGRMPALDSQLFDALAQQFGQSLHADSGVLPAGQCGVVFAINHARQLLYEKNHRHVLLVAADSLLEPGTLEEHLEQERILCSDVAAGYIPGEAAAALLLQRPDPHEEIQMLVQGLGAARENVTLGRDEPLRADGLTQAIQMALAEAQTPVAELECCISDVSGEAYYFEELILAQQRTGIGTPLWLPAECVGETGSVAGFIALAWLLEARRKDYVQGLPALLVQSNDTGQRTAMVVHFSYSAAFAASLASDGMI